MHLRVSNLELPESDLLKPMLGNARESLKKSQGSWAKVPRSEMVQVVLPSFHALLKVYGL